MNIRYLCVPQELAKLGSRFRGDQGQHNGFGAGYLAVQINQLGQPDDD